MSPLLLRRLSDELLGSRLASGEAAAFDELYRRYVHRLSAYGAHLLGDAAAGDDVAQSTLLKAYGALRDGRVPERVKPWLFRIAHNTAIDLVVRRRELPSGDLPERPVTDGEPFAGVLVAALAGLPERQRRVYVLRELHGLRIDETAAELGLTTAQVEQSLFAARNRLAEHLVFGDRLNCVSVQRLAAGPLDVEERRALKSHLRSCSACRSALGLRGRALELLPVASFDWLRGLATGLLSGGAPVAAKVGAVVATATVAAAVPVAVERSTHEHHHQAPARTARPAVNRAGPSARRIADLTQTLSLASSPVEDHHRGSGSAPSAHEDRHGGGGSDGGGSDGGPTAGVIETRDGGGTSSDGGGTSSDGGATSGGGGLQPTATSTPSGSDGGGSSDGGHTTTTSTTPTTTTTTSSSSDGDSQPAIVTEPTTTTTMTTTTTTTTTTSNLSGDGGTSGSGGGDSSSGTDGLTSDH